MEEREEKLNRAREKLDKFRKKKNKIQNQDAALENKGAENVSGSANSPETLSPVGEISGQQLQQQSANSNNTVDNSQPIHDEFAPSVEDTTSVHQQHLHQPPATVISSSFDQQQQYAVFESSFYQPQQQLPEITSSLDQQQYSAVASSFYPEPQQAGDVSSSFPPPVPASLSSSASSPFEMVTGAAGQTQGDIASYFASSSSSSDTNLQFESLSLSQPIPAPGDEDVIQTTAMEPVPTLPVALPVPQSVEETAEALTPMAEPSLQLAKSDSISSFEPAKSFDNSAMIWLEAENFKVKEQVKLLQEELENERRDKAKLRDEMDKVKGDNDKIEMLLVAKSAEIDNLQNLELASIKSDLQAKTQTIELLVGDKSELQTANQSLQFQNQNLQQQKSMLEASVEQLSAACTQLKEQVDCLAAGGGRDEERDKELASLRDVICNKEESYKELKTKLTLLTEEHDKLKQTHCEASSELEMCKVHLAQLRGSGVAVLGQEKDTEIARLGSELSGARSGLLEANERITGLAGERDQMAEQYRSYSRDLANQAERLGEQLAQYQQENARLVHREAGLVTHLASLESQLQGYLKEGRNVTEEELCRLRERVISLETDIRFVRDEKEKLQQMYGERGIQVDEMVSRLGRKDNEIMELRALVSGLETTVDMLKTTSQSSGQDQTKLLAACQSDKVAASRAMQQNIGLKERLEELQGALVSLTNQKADVMDRLDSATRKLSNYNDVDAEISARDEAVKEKDRQLNQLKTQVKHLTDELNRRREAETEVGQVKDVNANPGASEDTVSLVRDLEAAREMVRSLNSQNSELRSKLEVLSANTRECSETRSNSSASSSEGNFTNRDAIEESSCDTSSSESLEDLNSDKSIKDPSNESFDNVSNVAENVQETIINTTDLPFVPNQMNSFKSLEVRHIKAMEQVAKLTLEKDQLEYIIGRLQDETETVGDYVVMYQHQRQQQKLRLQEKEEQLAQVARDKDELRVKLSSLQEMVTRLISRDQGDPAPITETGIELGEEATSENGDITESKTPAVSDDREKILELIADIGSGSETMMANYQECQPWFWVTSPYKVMTV